MSLFSSRKTEKLLWILAITFITIALGYGTQSGDTPTDLAKDITDISSPPIATSSPPGYVPIIHVVDGDTFDIMRDGQKIRIRVIGLDTPESVDPRKTIQCFGTEASNMAKKLLQGHSVKLAQDSKGDKIDKYGRELAYVYLEDNTIYEEFMIRNGFGHEYTFNKKKYDMQSLFRAAEQEAQEYKRGFWSPNTCNGNTLQPAK